MELKYIECMCSCEEHVLRFKVSPEDKDFTVIVSTFMYDYDNVFKRIWTAIKYIFRQNCKYGHFPEYIACGEQLPEFIELFENTYKEYLEHKDK